MPFKRLEGEQASERDGARGGKVGRSAEKRPPRLAVIVCGSGRLGGKLRFGGRIGTEMPPALCHMPAHATRATFFLPSASLSSVCSFPRKVDE